MSWIRLLRDSPVFPYPTGASFISQVIMGAGLGLLGVAGGVHLASVSMPLFWLLLPAFVALVAAWALGPGMREDLWVDREARALMRRIHTLGIPNDEELLTPPDLRMIATACLSAEDGGPRGAYCVAVDWRSRWLVLSFHRDEEKARFDRHAVATALSLPEVEYPCERDWSPSWGRLQPSSPPPSARQPDLEPA